MAMKTISQTIEIDAPAERVWDVLLQDETFRQWTADFSPGSYAEADWQSGSKVVFRDGSGSGIFGHIVESVRPQRLDVECDGMLSDGHEDHDSPDSQAIKGAHETYQLTEQNGTTRLGINSDMSEEYYDEMSAAWVRALAKAKALAETG